MKLIWLEGERLPWEEYICDGGGGGEKEKEMEGMVGEGLRRGRRQDSFKTKDCRAMENFGSSLEFRKGK